MVRSGDKEETEKAGVTDVRRVTIKKNNENIQTDNYILTFIVTTISKEIKIGYKVEKTKAFIPNPLAYYDCQRFGHHEKGFYGNALCG